MDPNEIDCSKIVIDLEGIKKINAHRFEMLQLDAIVHLDLEKDIIVGFKDQRLDEFWVRGHLPGYPLMPGVLMLEAAAQLCSIFTWEKKISDKIIGLGGFDVVKFRDRVFPGDRLVLMCSGKKLNRRACTFYANGFVGSTMVFHAEILGMPIMERKDVMKDGML